MQPCYFAIFTPYKYKSILRGYDRTTQLDRTGARTGKLFQKILRFIFYVLFFGYRVPSFAVKSYFCTYIGTAKPVRLPVAPKHGSSTIFMSPIGCNPYGDSILPTTLSISSPKVAKNDKNPGFFYLFS
jgi:hypothetical protein